MQYLLLDTEYMIPEILTFDALDLAQHVFDERVSIHDAEVLELDPARPTVSESGARMVLAAYDKFMPEHEARRIVTVWDLYPDDIPEAPEDSDIGRMMEHWATRRDGEVRREEGMIVDLMSEVPPTLPDDADWVPGQ